MAVVDRGLPRGQVVEGRDQHVGVVAGPLALVLGVALDRLPGPDIDMWAFGMDPDKTGAGGALVHMPGFPSGGNSTLVYFACEDCAVEEARVEACGGRIQRPKMSIGEYGFITLAFDTEGNMIGLYSQK
mgnify:CR=1 FL=1